MKQIIYILLPLFLLLISCQQEVSPDQAERFIKLYGNGLVDEARDVAVLDDGSYAICGVDSVAGEGKRMVLVVTDKFGNMKSGFPKYYSMDGLHSGANAMVVKRGGQGGFLLVGYIERPQGDSFQKDLFLVKTTVTGEEVWKKSFGSSEDESVLHATEMISSGGFILAGYQVKNGKTDIMVMGVTEQGDSIKLGLNYNNPYSDNAAANFIYNTGEQYLCVCTYDKIGSEGTDILILNFDDDLSPNDEILGGDFNEFGQCIVEDEPGTYLVLGNRINVNGNSEVVVHLIETNGLLITKSLLLATITELNADLIAKRVIKTGDGRFAIVGTRQTDGNSDIFLQFILPDYQVSSERRIYGAAGNQRGADIDLTEGGGLIIAGTNSGGSNSMISLIKTGNSGEL